MSDNAASTQASPTRDSSGQPSALIGVEDLEPPKWASAHEAVANASLWQTLRELPTAATVVARLAWSTAPGLTLIAAVVQLVSGCVTAFGLFATANVFTGLLQAGPTPERVMASLPAVALVVSAFALRGALDTAVTTVQGMLTPRVRQAARDEVNTAVSAVELITWEDADFRELARQGGHHGVAAVETSVRGVAEIASAIVSLAAALITAGLLSPWLVPVLLVSAGAEAWATMQIARLGYQSFLAMVTRQLRLYVVENLLVARDVAVERHALTLQDTLLDEHRRISRDIEDETIRLERRKGRVRLLGRTLAGLGTGLSYLVLGLLLYAAMLPLAIAGAAVVAMRTASSALANTMRAVNRLYEDSYFVRFYNKLLADARAWHPRPSAIAAPRDPVMIRLENVWFSYPGKDEPALRGIDLTVHRGEIIALVGENGSGKTTLGKLLTGLYPPSRGRVWWDDIDLATADARTAHEQIAIIAQEPARWPMTAESNIRIGGLDRHDPDHHAWHEAVLQSGADDVLDSLPHGHNTILSRQFREGQDLSGGQWQRLGVARGIYRDAAILVADEPTAALDAKAEARVFAGLQHASQVTNGHRPHRTTILVTHRLANIRHSDRILVLDAGHIVESGTHDELMGQQGLYHQLYTIQASAYQSGLSALNGTLCRDRGDSEL